MTRNSGKSINSKERDSTKEKLRPGSWNDNLPDPFHGAAAVDSLFRDVKREKKRLKKLKSTK